MAKKAKKQSFLIFLPIFCLLSFFIVAPPSLASFDEPAPSELVPKDAALPRIQWTGSIRCEERDVKASTCTELRFVRKDGKDFPVDRNARLAELAFKTDPVAVKIWAKKTPRFLFWGGILIVQRFELVPKEQ